MAAADFRKVSAAPQSKSYLRDVVRRSFPNLPYDEAAATWHGEERARLEALGKPAPFVDGQIAGVAQVHGLVLVTTNEAHFEGFGDSQWRTGELVEASCSCEDIDR